MKCQATCFFAFLAVLALLPLALLPGDVLRVGQPTTPSTPQRADLSLETTVPTELPQQATEGAVLKRCKLSALFLYNDMNII